MTKKERKNVSYPIEFKIMAVEMYLNLEMGYRPVAKKLGIKSKTQLENWVRRYQALGIAGLEPLPKRGRPSLQYSTSNTQKPEDEIIKLRAENAFLKRLLLVERS